MSRNQRLSFLGIAAVIAVVAIVVLTTGGSGDTSTDDSANTAGQQTATPSATPTAAESDDATPTPTPTPTAKPKPQAPLLVAGKVAELRYKEGETVRFRVRSDKPEEVHIHGYDIKKDVGAGETWALLPSAAGFVDFATTLAMLVRGRGHQRASWRAPSFEALFWQSSLGP